MRARCSLALSMMHFHLSWTSPRNRVTNIAPFFGIERHFRSRDPRKCIDRMIFSGLSGASETLVIIQDTSMVRTFIWKEAVSVSLEPPACGSGSCVKVSNRMWPTSITSIVRIHFRGEEMERTTNQVRHSPPTAVAVRGVQCGAVVRQEAFCPSRTKSTRLTLAVGEILARRGPVYKFGGQKTS